MLFSAEKVLSRAQARGVTFIPDGDLVRFRPASALTPEMIDELRRHKEGILKILCREGVPVSEAQQDTSDSVASVGDWREAWPRDFKVYEGGKP